MHKRILNPRFTINRKIHTNTLTNIRIRVHRVFNSKICMSILISNGFSFTSFFSVCMYFPFQYCTGWDGWLLFLLLLLFLMFIVVVVLLKSLSLSLARALTLSVYLCLLLYHCVFSNTYTHIAKSLNPFVMRMACCYVCICTHQTFSPFTF
jgi:hypothetical protein